jgi:hypothetical protein
MKNTLWIGILVIIGLMIMGCAKNETATGTSEKLASTEKAATPSSDVKTAAAETKEAPKTEDPSKVVLPETKPVAAPTPVKPEVKEAVLPKVEAPSGLTAAYEFTADLSDFPKMFVSKNAEQKKEFNGFIIVGAKATPKDVIAAQSVATAINGLIRRTDYSVGAVMDSQISDVKNVNAIVIGSPCENSAAKVLLGSDCKAGLASGKAKVKLFSNNGKIQIAVVGYSPDDTIRASDALADYIMNPLSGTESTV